jgi:hypothetical protein
MDAYTTETLSAIGLLILIAVLWLIWKFFYTIFKHVLIALFLAAIGSGVYYYLMRPPPKDPNIGKFAYSSNSGRYLGVIEGAAEDSQLGAVWIVRPTGGYPTKYSKGRIVLKDKRDPEPLEQPSPSPTDKNQGSSGITVEAPNILCVSARKLHNLSGQARCVGTSWPDF